MRGGRANLDAAGGGDLSNFSFGEAHFRTFPPPPSLPDNYCTVPYELCLGIANAGPSISSNNSRGRLLFERGDYLKHCSLEVVP